MSSHREAPEIAKDPVADSADVYAFRDRNDPDFVTIIATYVPLQDPASGPNFFEFGDDVKYDINISNSGDAQADITYSFRFTTEITNPDTFLYNNGQVTSLDDANLIRRQTYTVTRTKRGGRPKVLGRGLRVPPCNVGPRSTPDYEKNLGAPAVRTLNDGATKVFAGQRRDGFWVDLGSIFDLGGLRPLNEAHLIPLAKENGVNSLVNVNVHAIALQVRISDLTASGSGAPAADSPDAVIGVWTAASRQRVRVFDNTTKTYVGHGKFTQVSRLGNPLFNEVLVPMSRKDEWNADTPDQDSEYAAGVNSPELQALLPFLYPGAFPNLDAYDKPRADLNAILLTGIPSGVVPGFQNNTGATEADFLRLNVAVDPSPYPNRLGLVAGDPAGFPNGRRVTDDVVTIELRAIAGLTIPLVDPTYTVDAVVNSVADGTRPEPFLKKFPYLNTPASGYDVP